MKMKHLLVGIGLIVIAGGLWLGRAAWRAHQQIVTLHVRNEPLRNVLRSLERQTWKKIRAESSLDARITLNVTDKPLSYVLDLIGEQSGARWTTLHAVYGSAARLRALDTALSGDGKLEPAGWTKIAPASPTSDLPAPEGDIANIRLGGPGPDGSMPPPGAGPGVIVRRTSNGAIAVQSDDREVKLSPGTKEGPKMQRVVINARGGPGGQTMMRQVANGPMIVQNGNCEVEVWSSEELLLESALKEKLDLHSSKSDSDPAQARPATANAEAAAKTAKAVKGKYADFIALRKSILGMGFSMSGHGPPGPNALKQAQYDRFARLTPEQRVQRARQRLALTQKSTNQPPQ